MQRVDIKKVNALLYIVSMMFAFTTRYGDFRIGRTPQIVIGTAWIAIALGNLAMNRFSFNGEKNQDIKFFLKIYLLPHIFIHAYTIFLMIIGNVSWTYLTTNVSVYIPTAVAILAIYLFKEKALNYTIIALFSSWILSVIASTLLKGPLIFPHAIMQAYINPADKMGGLTSNYLELHDLVLAVGYLLVFLIFSKQKLTYKNFTMLMIVLFIIVLGMKRAAILGLIIMLFFYFLSFGLSYSGKIKLCKIAGWFGFFACYTFIYILSEGSLFYELLDKYGINSMGRNYYYKAVMNYASFSPSFFGIGRNVVTKLMYDELSYLRVGGVHSDIIKMYVENGFIVFGLWLWYYLIHITQKYRERFGDKSAFVYFGIVIYTFSLYLTDNIEIYFICQIFSIMLPASYAMYKRDKIYIQEN